MRDGTLLSTLRCVVGACVSFCVAAVGCSDATCPRDTMEINGQCVAPNGTMDLANTHGPESVAGGVAGSSISAPAPSNGPQAGTPAGVAGASSSPEQQAPPIAGARATPSMGLAGSGTPPDPGRAGAGPEVGAGGADSVANAGAAAPEGDAVCAGRNGEYVCEGAVLHQCDAAGNSLQQADCMSEARCLAGVASGLCGSCDPGSVQCVSADLQICNMQGEFETRETCESAALCSAESQSCTPGQCRAGQFSCADGSLGRCKADLTGFEQIQACRAELCDAEAGKCNQCVPGSARCEGNALVECNDSGTFARRVCSGATPRCAGERCVQCATAMDCEVAECRTATCDRGTGSCSAGTPSPAGTPCSGGRVCNGEGACVECVADDDCDDHEMCMDRTCRARKPFEAGTLGAGYRVTLAPGYSFRVSAVYSPTNIGRRPVELSGVAGCSTIGDPSPPSSDPSQPIKPGPRASAVCNIAASTQARTLTLRGTTQSDGPNIATNTQPCPDGKRIMESGGTLTLGFEDYPEANVSVADCRDPHVVIDSMP